MIQVEAEVLRLEQHKASKMKELVLKKKTELEEHRRRAHLVGEEGYATQFTVEAIEAGNMLWNDSLGVFAFPRSQPDPSARKMEWFINA